MTPREQQLESALRAVEWFAGYFDLEVARTIERTDPVCTKCQRRKTQGHAADCVVGRALADAPRTAEVEHG